ncbi:MAG: hypothetical protein AABZ60_06505 [Planctomycetota bacterium]
MSEITIRLRADLETGKKDIIIELAPDSSMLPYEHEAKHREIVEQLLGQGILKPEEVGGIKIERIKEELPEISSSKENEEDSRRAEEVRQK